MTANEFTDRFDYDPDNDLLGEGGFGKIFKAWDKVRNEYIALKLSKVQPNMEEFSLLSEYKRVCDLEHTNIARYMDCQRIRLPGIGTHDVALMKYYEHGNLSQLLGKHTLTTAQKDRIVDGLLDGINYLHRHRPLIIHSDLKPSNILIVERRGFYIPLITDFGISRQASVDDKSYVTNTIGAGTYAYAAPEQWEARELRPNVDLWSFGILAIYVWFNGKKLPFRADDISIASEAGRIEFMKRVVNLDFIPDLMKVPDKYRTIVATCLVVSPQQRIKTVDELLAHLHPKEIATAPEETTQVLPPPTPPKKPIRIHDERTELMPVEVPLLPPPPPRPVEKVPAAPAPTPGKSNVSVWVAASVVIAMIVGGTIWYALQDHKTIATPEVAKVPANTTAPIRPDTVSLAPPKLNLEPVEEKKPDVKASIAAAPKPKVPATAPKKKTPDPKAIYRVVDESPSFPGGESAMRFWLARNRRTPEAAERSFISGVVKVAFVVNTDGSRQDITVIKSVGYGCDEEAVRLVKSMPRWNPGRFERRLVRASHTIDVVFE
ncbi:TonB family protein [Salmonirosea aquatica]|uniref:TonB family protein n=1 Tax=Salmonirosea aquatica TaxID=2654236 RepID=A0A7C9BF22_9BACT|nr:TonB family protein [Cytophagaceae bacterium SJW1-29]